MQKTTAYELSRNWFDWSFENPDLISPNHTALYFFIIEHCNRLGWKEKFGLPTLMAKDAIGIKSYNTYIKTLNDLVNWGFIKLLEKSKNQYSANIVALSKNNKATNKALDKAMMKHVTKQLQSTGESIDSIDKPITNNNITNNHLSLFNEFRKNYPGTKKGSEVEFENGKKKHKDWEQIVPLLQTALTYQIGVRAKLKSIPGKFVPEWKNLQTWINQRCWEEEIEGSPIVPVQTIAAERTPHAEFFNTTQ